MSPDSRPDIERVRTVLRHLIDLSGLSRHEIRKRLHDDGHGAYLAGVLSGRIQLKLHHVLDLLRVLDLQPMELFRLVFREPSEPSPLIHKLNTLVSLRGSIPRTGRTTAPSSSSVEDLRAQVAALRRDVQQLRTRLDRAQPERREKG
jgi:hypothetical protein